VIEETLLEAMDGMAKALEHVQSQFLGVRTGRATSNLVEKIAVEYYGATVPMVQLASFQVPDARTLVIKPHDRGSIAAIEKAIQSSDLGVTPGNDGVVVRLSFPMLTEERRKEFVKIARKYGEECKVSIRKARHDALDMLTEIDDGGQASSDEVERAKKKAEEAVSDGVKTVDSIVAQKERDIMEV